VHDITVWRVLGALPPRERMVICWRYGLGCDPVEQATAAERLRCSARWVYELEQRGLALLRGELYRRFLTEAV
jgi:DNA-directed RNA polymerase specialized sigma24 family protein